MTYLEYVLYILLGYVCAYIEVMCVQDGVYFVEKLRIISHNAMQLMINEVDTSLYSRGASGFFFFAGRIYGKCCIVHIARCELMPSRSTPIIKFIENEHTAWWPHICSRHHDEFSIKYIAEDQPEKHHTSFPNRCRQSDANERYNRVVIINSAYRGVSINFVTPSISKLRVLLFFIEFSFCCRH